MTAALPRTDAALLAAILEKPEDDGLRLIYADWLDENGEPERAEFIRLQIKMARCRMCHRKDGTERKDSYAAHCGRCVPGRRRERQLLAGTRPWDWAPPAVREWICENVTEAWNPSLASFAWRRGFVGSVSLACAAFLCPRCGGRGRRPFIEGITHRCEDCGGTGGRGRELAARCPLTAVRLVDREPAYYQLAEKRSVFGWARWRTWQDSESHELPEELWRLVAERPGVEIDGRWADSPTREAADAALSAACVRFARREAGLE